jgi:aminotransferase
VNLDDIRALDGAKLRYALMDLAKEIPDAIALGRGDPDLDAPDHVIAAARAAAAQPLQPLAPIHGTPELRAAIARRARARPRPRRRPDHVLVTTGGQEGLFLVMEALLDPGDEILVPDPRYTSYDQAIEHCGAVSVTVPTHPEDAFDVRAETLEALITPRRRRCCWSPPATPPAGSSPAARPRRSRPWRASTASSSSPTRSTASSCGRRTSTSRSARCPAWPTARSRSRASPRPGP